MIVTQNTTTRHNLSSEALATAALANNEAIKAANGALTVTTGKRTGRSPKDRYIVRDSITEGSVDWGAVNQPIGPEVFDRLWEKASSYLSGKEYYSGQYRVGSDPVLGLSVQAHTEWAWHQLFVKNLFIDDDVAAEGQSWTLLNAASLTLDPDEDGIPSDGCVIINFSKQSVLLIGMHYAGEMKKSLFTALNFILPEKKVLPMHCAANSKEDGSNLALFFGLSGTGKTTLSADPDRFLIGDDEHGWSSEQVFNFEGGCYAKCIDLSIEREPVIWKAIREGAIMENVVLDDALSPVFTDDSLTQNTRAAYPLSHIPKRVIKNAGNTPDAVLFLTCDLYGVLPPVAKLTPEQAAYYFLSGYTALVGSTEVGSAPGVKPTFSTCFGAPFFPRSPSVYADLLIERLEADRCPVYLVNTGWTGGAYEAGGKRFSIPTTRAVVTAIVDDTLTMGGHLPGFNVQIAAEIPGVESELLDPRNTWSDQAEYQKKANTLITGFQDNFVRFTVSDAIQNAGPVVLE